MGERGRVWREDGELGRGGEGREGLLLYIL